MRISIEKGYDEVRFVVSLSHEDIDLIPELNLHQAKFFDLSIEDKIRYLAYLAESQLVKGRVRQ